MTKRQAISTDPFQARTMDTQWRHKSKMSEKMGRCGRQNMLRPYLKIWEWIFGRAVKAISFLGVRVICNLLDLLLGLDNNLNHNIYLHCYLIFMYLVMFSKMFLFFFMLSEKNREYFMVGSMWSLFWCIMRSIHMRNKVN